MESIVHSASTLTVIASIAIAIAGFSGVVVALTGKTTERFDPVERLNLRILLQVSAEALFFSLMPLIAHRAFDSDTAWRLSMLLYGSVHVLDAGYFVVRTLRSHSRSRVQLLMPILGTCIAVVQLIIGVIGSIVLVEVAYLLVLTWHLAIAGMGFVFLIFASRYSGNV